MQQDWLIDGADDAPLTLVLTHGAGAPMDTEFMNGIAQGVAAGGFRVVRFEFPYMARRRTTGKKGGPDRMPVLQATFNDAIAQLGDPAKLVLSGKSMGGRVASMIADEQKVAGLICLGYPFHPPGKKDKLRTEHLLDLQTPTLILQGERDTFGNLEDVPGYGLSRKIHVHWLPDGDHSFKPRKRSGHTEEGNLAKAVEHMLTFLNKLADA